MGKYILEKPFFSSIISEDNFLRSLAHTEAAKCLFLSVMKANLACVNIELRKLNKLWKSVYIPSP